MSLIIEETELNERLERSEIVYKRMGHGSDDSPRPRSTDFKSGIPNFVRELMAAEVKSGKSQTSVAKDWGVSNTAVRYAAEGRIGAHQLKGEEEKLVEESDRLATKINEKTLEETANKLLLAVSAIDEDKVKNEKPVIQTVIARNLAGVIEKLRPNVAITQNIQFNVMVPTQKKLSDFGEPIRVIEAEVVRR